MLAPLQLGGRSIGALAISRTEPSAFSHVEIDLVTLLGRLVATAVQNLRTYEAERATVEELRRLSELRADFVSLVSHELRNPITAVIGSARTLQDRWRELKPDQREAFLTVIADETTRLAALVGDVLDTSRIEAGTFGYAFAEVDLANVLRDSVAAAGIGQDEVRLRSELPATLPAVRGDAERLRQLVDNLISNAIKYSDSGGEVHVEARADDGHVVVRVSDTGPGIAPEHQAQIFEKFGRVAGNAKPGTGLGPLPLALVRRGARRLSRGRLCARRGRGLHADVAGLLTRESRRSSQELRGALRYLGPDVLRLDDDRLAAVSEDLAEQPVAPLACAQDRDCRPVREPDGTLLDAVAGDRLRVADAYGPRVLEEVWVEALARLEPLVGEPGRAHPVEPERALAVGGPVPGVDDPVRQHALERVRLDQTLARRLLAFLQVVDRNHPALLDRLGQRCDELLLVALGGGSGVWWSSNWPNVSSSFFRTRSSGVCTWAAIEGPTMSSASRIARASSGVRRGASRKTSP